MRIIVGLVVLFIGMALYATILYLIGKLSYKLFPGFELFENDNVIYYMINGMWCIAIILSILLCIGMSFIIGSIILSQI